MNRISYDRVVEFSRETLKKCGMTETDAQIAAHVLAESDLRGVHTHGSVRLLMYRDWYAKGLIKPLPNYRIIKENETRAMIDGDNGLGLVSAAKAMRYCLERAERGIYTVALRNTNHTGMQAYYAMMALKEDMIGIAMSTAGPNVAPFGGIKPLIGANPIAVAIPSGKEPPFIFDASTSVVARGKIIMAAKRGEEIPMDWALDENGRPTENAAEALKGAVLPMAGAKGYGLALMIEILSTILTDSESNGTLMMAINIGSFTPLEPFKARMDEWVRRLKDSPPMKGFERIFVPGEKSSQIASENRKKGIAFDEKVIEELGVMAEEFGIKPLGG